MTISTSWEWGQAMQMCFSYAMFGLCMILSRADEIKVGEQSISIIDNDDFSNDTLTGGGIAHHCNWMFLWHLDDQNIKI